MRRDSMLETPLTEDAHPETSPLPVWLALRDLAVSSLVICVIALVVRAA